jgi:hypothetical protein
MASPQAKRNGAIGGVAAAIIAATVALEGGWVNNPADPGGETNLGITKRVAVDHGYTGPMRSLPRGVAESIYYETYLVKPGYAPLIDVDAAVTEELFDTTVNMGAPRPSRWFQQSINMLCDSRLARTARSGQARSRPMLPASLRSDPRHCARPCSSSSIAGSWPSTIAWSAPIPN